MEINRYGFIRVAAASPKLEVANCDYNTAEIIRVIEHAQRKDVQIVCFPELCITAYSCGDLFFQRVLQEEALKSLVNISRFMKGIPSMTAIVGLPILLNNKLYNAAAVVSSEGIMGVVPKTYLTNHNGFHESRWFAPSDSIGCGSVTIGDEEVSYFSESLIFKTPFANFGVEICEDLWTPVPPSSLLAMQGADMIFNLSASNDIVGKHNYRRSLVIQQSGRCHSAYIYASAGTGESTTDMVFSGACLIAENGSLLNESKRYSMESELIVADIDIDALRHDKMKNITFRSISLQKAVEIDCPINPISPPVMERVINPHPFIPSSEDYDEHLSEVFNIQTMGLAKRLSHTNTHKVVIGVSGGLDSTLALLVAIDTFDRLGLPRDNIHGITMPGLGTTKRTYDNAIKLMEKSRITVKEISIAKAVTQHFEDIGHDGKTPDATYENSQARERTQILMDYANKVGGLVVGTGNMSELALGWATYNGDHMSMYAVNTGIPKTLVGTLTRWIADSKVDEPICGILHDILDTPFSPELLPASEDGEMTQETENFVGPYELHDFFMYRALRWGDAPRRILFLAQQAFNDKYSDEEILKWLKIFYNRFFAQQFKRSCLPDGPKAGSVNLSPRGDWRMPSDASPDSWLNDLE